jgi:hypothetical protein
MNLGYGDRHIMPPQRFDIAHSYSLTSKVMPNFRLWLVIPVFLEKAKSLEGYVFSNNATV